MSSLSIARARRAAAESNEQRRRASSASVDELALPGSWGVRVRRASSAKPIEKSSSSGPQPESFQDESDPERYGGLPKEIYRPRPSRSRSKATDLVSIDQTDKDNPEQGFAVVVPRGEHPQNLEHIPDVNENDEDKATSTLDQDSRLNNFHPDSQYFETHSKEQLPQNLTESELPDVYKIEAHELSGKKGRKKSERGRKTSFLDVEDDAMSVDEKRDLQLSEVGAPPEQDQTNPLGHAVLAPPETVPEEQPAEPVNAPKKRGRRRKKMTAENTPEPALVAAQQTETNSPHEVTTDTRKPLAEQDANTLLQGTKEPKNIKSETRPSNNTSEGQDEYTAADKLPNAASDAAPPQVTPKKPVHSEKGPDKHSPISKTNKVPFRVGLSRKARIAPLLRVIKK
jgi:hypothetical protein